MHICTYGKICRKFTAHTRKINKHMNKIQTATARRLWPDVEYRYVYIYPAARGNPATVPWDVWLVGWWVDGFICMSTSEPVKQSSSESIKQ